MTHVLTPFNVEAIARRPSVPICVIDQAEAVPIVEALLPGHAVISIPTPNGADTLINWVMTVGGHILLWTSRGYPTKKRQALAHALKAVGARKVTTVKYAEGDPDGPVEAATLGWDETAVIGWLQAQNIGEPHCPELPDVPAPQEVEVTSPLERRLTLGLDLVGGKTQALGNLNNATLILEQDDHFKDRIWYCEFQQRIMTDYGGIVREWTDGDDIITALYMQRAMGVTSIAVKTVTQAVQGFANGNIKNCVKDYLDAQEWDGVPRIQHFFSEHFGVTDNDYSQAVSRNFFIGMVARIYTPGCQLKNMVILEGVQDASKSSALNALVGDSWFAEQHESVMHKGFFEVLQGKWLIEIPEMDAFGRAEISRVKAVVSCRSDRYRAAYGRHAQDHLRTCNFVGTTNKYEGGVFNDDTGAVRFWPLTCNGSIDRKAIAKARNQLFAEAVAAYKDGATWWIVPTSAATEQKSRFVQDVWHDTVLDYANAQISRKVTITQILAHLGKKTADQNRLDQMRVSSILKLDGWKRKQDTDGKWFYVKDIPTSPTGAIEVG